MTTVAAAEARVQSPLARLALMPTRILGRLRPDLAASVTADEARFGGTAQAAFLVLAVIAVAYPIVASVAHRFGDVTLGGDALSLALRPGFDVVYSESLPFMLAAVGLGLFSPALGVLFMTVFIPADLLAAFGTLELASNQYSDTPSFAPVARLASCGLLWLLAVEIPLRVRSMTAASGGSSNGTTGIARAATVAALATAALVFLWTAALPLLITPVFTWSMLQQSTKLSSDPTWAYWPVLVVGAAIVAGIAVAWPRPVSPVPLPATSGRGAEPSTAALLARQTIAALVIALLLGGLITSMGEAIALIGGLLAAGPVLTLVLPGMPVPGRLARLDRRRRWVIGMGTAIGLDAVVILVLGKSLFATDYLAFTVMLDAAIAVFRIILEAGTGKPPIGTATGLSRTAAVVSALSVAIAHLP
jgi:hypothetical protein